MNLHNGNFRFKCDICGKKFIQKNGLLNHQKVKNGAKIKGTCAWELKQLFKIENDQPKMQIDQRKIKENTNKPWRRISHEIDKSEAHVSEVIDISEEDDISISWLANHRAKGKY